MTRRARRVTAGLAAALTALGLLAACEVPAQAQDRPDAPTVPLRSPISIPLRGAEAISGCISGTSIRLTVTDDGRDSDGSSSMVQDPTCADV